MNLYVFLSALYTLRYVPIVNISCNYIFIQKKKKKKKKKNDPYFGMGKNTKVMPQYPTIYLFSWEREGILTSQTLHKANTSVLSDLPPAHNDLDKASTMHLKIAQNMYIFSCKFCTFRVTEGNEIWHIYFQFMILARKLTHTTKFECFWMQKDTNFGNTIIIRHLGPEKCQKSDPERHEF